MGQFGGGESAIAVKRLVLKKFINIFLKAFLCFTTKKDKIEGARFTSKENVDHFFTYSI